jgi:hypothetical protein
MQNDHQPQIHYSAELSAVINQIIQVFESMGLEQKPIIPCHCRPLPLHAFIDYAARYFHLQLVDLVFTLVYLQRSWNHLQRLKATQICMEHRIFLAAMTTAHKFIHDQPPISVPPSEEVLKAFRLWEHNYHNMELNFMALLKWQLYVSVPTVEEVCTELQIPVSRLEKSCASMRGLYSLPECSAAQ